MARPSTVLVIFIVSMNAMSLMLVSTGTADMLGLDTAVDAPSDKIEQAQQEAQSVDTGSSLGGTLFGMYNTLGAGVGTIFGLVTAGPALMGRAGLPDPLVAFLASVCVFVVAFDVISFLRGYSL